MSNKSKPKMSFLIDNTNAGIIADYLDKINICNDTINNSKSLTLRAIASDARKVLTLSVFRITNPK